MDKEPRRPPIEPAIAITSMRGAPDRGRNFMSYCEALGIDLNGFEDKRVLDLGADEHLGFARELDYRGIKTRSTVSLSPSFSDARWNHADGYKDRSSDLMLAGYGEVLPLRDNSFDRLVCFNIVQHLTYAEALQDLLKEATRVLDKDGQAFIWPIGLTDNSPRNLIKFTYVNLQEHGTVNISEEELQETLGSQVSMRFTKHTVIEEMDHNDSDPKRITAYKLTLTKLS